jgi:hypothetical protein
VQRLVRRRAPYWGLGRPQGQGASEGGDPGGGVEARLDVDLPQLDRAQSRLRPRVPPDHRLVPGAASRTDRVERLDVMLPVAQGGRYAATRVCADDGGTRARHSRVESEPEGRTRPEPVQ